MIHNLRHWLPNLVKKLNGPQTSSASSYCLWFFMAHSNWLDLRPKSSLETILLTLGQMQGSVMASPGFPGALLNSSLPLTSSRSPELAKSFPVIFYFFLLYKANQYSSHWLNVDLYCVRLIQVTSTRCAMTWSAMACTFFPGCPQAKLAVLNAKRAAGCYPEDHELWSPARFLVLLHLLACTL